MKKLGIIGAMDVEVATLREKMTDLTIFTLAGMEFYDGKLCEMPAVVVQCGVGKVNAAMCAQILCACFHVTHLVNTGIAGSLCNELDIADILVSSDAMYHDFDCVHFGYEMGKVPGMDTVAFPADEMLVKYAYDAAQQVNPGHARIGRVASGDQFVADKEEKSRIVSVTSALCTEMEGAAIAQTAYRNGVPFVILRAISDKADDSAEMDYPTFERISAHRCAEITEKLAEKLSQDLRLSN